MFLVAYSTRTITLKDIKSNCIKIQSQPGCWKQNKPHTHKKKINSSSPSLISWLHSIRSSHLPDFIHRNSETSTSKQHLLLIHSHIWPYKHADSYFWIRPQQNLSLLMHLSLFLNDGGLFCWSSWVNLQRHQAELWVSVVSKSAPHACLQEAMCDCVKWLVYVTFLSSFYSRNSLGHISNRWKVHSSGLLNKRDGGEGEGGLCSTI